MEECSQMGCLCRIMNIWAKKSKYVSSFSFVLCVTSARGLCCAVFVLRGSSKLGCSEWNEKLVVARQVEKCPVPHPQFYGTQRLFITFVTTCHWSVSWARLIQLTFSYPNFVISSLILYSRLSSRPPNGRSLCCWDSNILNYFLLCISTRRAQGKNAGSQTVLQEDKCFQWDAIPSACNTAGSFLLSSQFSGCNVWVLSVSILLFHTSGEPFSLHFYLSIRIPVVARFSALGPTQPPVLYVPGQSRRDVELTSLPSVTPRLKNERIPLLPVWAFMACAPFYLHRSRSGVDGIAFRLWARRSGVWI